MGTSPDKSCDAGDSPRDSSPRPVAPAERIDGIDVLRGLALLGVLVVNVVFEFRVSIFEQLLAPLHAEAAIDRALKSFLTAAVELKALALFSFLFGVGLAIQFERLAENPRRFILLMRRLVILLAIGMVHLFLIWNGDILVEYAIAGFLVLPLLRAPRWLVLIAAGIALLLFLIWLPALMPFPSNAWISAHVAEADRVYGNGSFFEVLAFRIGEVPAIMPLHVLIFPRTVALFLFGVLAWRAKILLRPDAHRRLLFSLAAGGLVVGACLTVADQWRLGSVVVALGYAAIVFAGVSFPAGQRMLAWAAPVGRMAFTNYLTQSVILGWIFYGYGLGLFGRLSVTAAFAIGLGLYVTQVAFSAWWLGRYRYGPVEWLWRTLMYGRRQPMAGMAA